VIDVLISTYYNTRKLPARSDVRQSRRLLAHRAQSSGLVGGTSSGDPVRDDHIALTKPNSTRQSPTRTSVLAKAIGQTPHIARDETSVAARMRSRSSRGTRRRSGFVA
jgi:hypothetical protein